MDLATVVGGIVTSVAKKETSLGRGRFTTISGELSTSPAIAGRWDFREEASAKRSYGRLAMSAISKGILGVAGEYAVASELCRRNICAQPTFGNQKRLDLLAYEPDGRVLRIEVKSKQGPCWPNCRGIAGPHHYLVFVDFEKKRADERPDFYVLSSDDWYNIAAATLAGYRRKHPDRRAEVTTEGLLRLLDEVNAQGKPYEGCGVGLTDVRVHKEAWQKIVDALTAPPITNGIAVNAGGAASPGYGHAT
jgi:hypothetical protein